MSTPSNISAANHPLFYSFAKSQQRLSWPSDLDVLVTRKYLVRSIQSTYDKYSTAPSVVILYPMKVANEQSLQAPIWLICSRDDGVRRLSPS